MCIRDRYQRRVHGEKQKNRLVPNNSKKMRTTTFIIMAVLFCCGLTHYPSYDRCNLLWADTVQSGFKYCLQDYNPYLFWASEMTAFANILYTFHVEVPVDGKYLPATPLSVHNFVSSRSKAEGPEDYLQLVNVDYIKVKDIEKAVSWKSRGGEVIAVVKSTDEEVIMTDAQPYKKVQVLNSEGKTKYYDFSELNDVFYVLALKDESFLAQMVGESLYVHCLLVVLPVWNNA
eukprot:TRINITY_DN1523_c0_g1_i3.p1 TRINITY_DN1523_c0_g1~~TRINITY_DN1523_c0_g1_i3.p1  ORF type:complete len:254 (+),score=62.24 TRINITY_DN1523_c0_g1_i3:72-764(+)